jgi:glycerophosphoryl diester phosphodiesterase
MKKLILTTLISTLFIAVLAPVVRALPATGPWYQPRPGDQKPLILAHQGGEGEYPSNSMLAFTKAHQAGADALDTDMFMTSDKKLVLFHDETLEHRTNCTGAISSKTYQQLQQCDAAYYWSPDGGATFPYRGTGITIPTFEDLLNTFPSNRIGVEIKQTTTEASEVLCWIIAATGNQGRVLVSSSGQPNMNRFREVCPTVDTSATQDEVFQFFGYNANNNFPPGYNPPFSSLQVPEFFSGIPVITPSFVASAHNYGLKVYAWTIDTQEQTQHLVDLGVDGVNTSYPKRIIDWLATPLKSCGTLGTTYKLTNPPTTHLCVWVIQSWLNEARDKYNQENNPAWPSIAADGVYNAATRDLVTVWQYISNSQPNGLPVTGEANPATMNHMSLACVDAESTYSYNSIFC